MQAQNRFDYRTTKREMMATCRKYLSPVIISRHNRSAKLDAKRKLSSEASSEVSDNYSYNESMDSSSSPGELQVTLRVQQQKEVMISKSDQDKNSKHDGKSDNESSGTDSDLSENEFTVDEIKDMRVERGKRFFLVKWKDYGDEENTWEPEENMSMSQDLIKDFLAKREKERAAKRSKKHKSKSKQFKRRRITSSSISISTNSSNKSKSFEAEEEEEDIPALVTPEKNQEAVNSDNLPCSSLGELKSESWSPMENMENCDSGVPNSPLSLLSSTSDEPLTLEVTATAFQDFVINQKEQPKVVFKLRLWDNRNQQVDMLFLDITEDKEEYYNVILTEDIQGMEPHYIYGAAADIDGNRYCLVQFVDHPYVDVVPPKILLARFPSFRSYIFSLGNHH